MYRYIAAPEHHRACRLRHARTGVGTGTRGEDRSGDNRAKEGAWPALFAECLWSHFLKLRLSRF